MDATALVSSFNSLPRRELSPSGAVPNHWHFSIRHVPLHPPGNVLFILNPHARYVHVEGRLPDSIPNPSSGSNNASSLSPEAALTVAALLVKAFVLSESLAPCARPWSWATGDEGLARVVGEALRGIGVEGELREVGVAGAGENGVAEEEWARFRGQLERMVGGG
jgi:hypothetical protein